MTIPAGVTEILDHAFDGCTSLRDVYYAGSAEQWQAVQISESNDPLLNAAVHYNSTGPGKPEVDPNAFSMQNNTWSFGNAHEGFGYPNNYTIPPERYKEVLGDAYVNAAMTSQNQLYNSMMQPWGGNCYGMSVTAILFYLGRLDWSDYTQKSNLDFPTVNSYRDKVLVHYNDAYVTSGKDSPITRLIEQYQVYQYSNEYQEARKDPDVSTYRRVIGEYINYPSMGHKTPGTYIQEMLNKITAGIELNKPLALSLQFCYKGNPSGHEIMTRTDRMPEKHGDWWRVYVYDPNTPYMDPILKPDPGNDFRGYYYNRLIDPQNLTDSEDRYIELNPEENKRRDYGFDQYLGCDKK